MLDRTHDSRSLRMLTVVDDWTRECVATEVAQGMRAEQVLSEVWREECNRPRPHSPLSFRPPPPDAIQVAAGLI